MLIDNLTIQEAIGSGAYGVVFKAWSPDLKRHVAIKFGEFNSQITQLNDSSLCVPVLEYALMSAGLLDKVWNVYTQYADQYHFDAYMIMELAEPIVYDDGSTDEKETKRFKKLYRIGRLLSKRIWRRYQVEWTDYHPGNLVLYNGKIVACDL